MAYSLANFGLASIYEISKLAMSTVHYHYNILELKVLQAQENNAKRRR